MHTEDLQVTGSAAVMPPDSFVDSGVIWIIYLLTCDPHMPIGNVWIYQLLFVCVCTVVDFSAEDKANGVTFCTAVHRRPRQGISHFGELCSPRNQNRTNRLALKPRSPHVNITIEMRRSWNRAACGRRIGMCGYMSVRSSCLLYVLNYIICTIVQPDQLYIPTLAAYTSHW